MQCLTIKIIRNTLILFCFFNLQYLFAQNEYFFIVNSENKSAVQNATISGLNKGFIINADEKGRIEKRLLKKSDYVVGCIGNQTDTFRIEIAKDTFFMNSDTVTISPEVIVDNTALGKSRWFGFHRMAHSLKVLFKEPDDSHITTFIPMNLSEVLIEKIVLKMHQIPKHFTYRMSLYLPGKDGKPADVIWTKKFEHSSVSNTLKVKLNKNVKIQNGGLFVGFQWLRYENKSLLDTEREKLPRVKMTYKGEDNYTYFLSEGGFTFYNYWNKLEDPEGKHYNARFGLKIRDVNP